MSTASLSLWAPQSGAQQATGDEAPESQTGSDAAPPPEAKSLDELLEMVQKGFSQEREVNRQREERFQQAKEDQARLLERRGDRRAAEETLRLAAKELRAARRTAMSGSWVKRILDCAAGEHTPEELVRLADSTDREQVCEAYYYAGEVSLLRGEIEQARQWFRKCVATGLVFDPTTFPPEAMNEELHTWGTCVVSIDNRIQVTVLDYRPQFRRHDISRPLADEMRRVKALLEDTGLQTVIAQTSSGHIPPIRPAPDRAQ